MCNSLGFAVHIQLCWSDFMDSVCLTLPISLKTSFFSYLEMIQQQGQLSWKPKSIFKHRFSQAVIRNVAERTKRETYTKTPGGLLA